MSSTIAKLKKVYLFKDLNDKQLGQLEPIFTETEFEDGEEFIREDDLNEKLYFILSGRVKIKMRTAPDHHQDLAEIREGESVGEFLLVKTARRSCSAEAKGKVKAYVCDQGAIMPLLSKHYDIGYFVYRNLAMTLVDRLRDSNMLAVNALR